MEKLRSLDIGRLDIGEDESCRAFMYFMPQGSYSMNCKVRMNVVDHLREGYPYSVLMAVLHRTCINRNELSKILHTSTRQLNRYKDTDRLSAEQSGFLYEFSRLYVRGLDIFGDQETFEKWIQRPQMALGMQVPVQLLVTTEGFRMVNDLLSQVEYGFVS